MGVTFFEPAPIPINEAMREASVERSGALSAVDDSVLQEIVERARRSFHTESAAISIVYRDWQYLIAAVGLAPGVYSRRTSFCGHALLRPDDIFFVPDADDDVRFAGNPAVQQDKLLRFYAGAPLRGMNSMPLGAFCVFDPSPRATMSDEDIAKLRNFADEVMSRLESLKSAGGLGIAIGGNG